jgi:signal peptidase II
MSQRLSVRENGIAWLIASAGVMVIDQITKTIALAQLEPYAPHEVIPGFFNLTLAFNTGAAFSFLADQPGWQRWLFTLLAIVVTIALTFWLKTTRRDDWKTALPISLVIGGAVGNLIDRIHVGMVTDFIQVYYRDWVFPSFNVADSAISVGATLLVLFGLFSSGKRSAGAVK